MPVRSVYPYIDNNLRKDMHRIVYPVDYSNRIAVEPISVMWSYFNVKPPLSPNHFVALLPASDTGEKDKIV